MIDAPILGSRTQTRLVSDKNCTFNFVSKHFVVVILTCNDARCG